MGEIKTDIIFINNFQNNRAYKLNLSLREPFLVLVLELESFNEIQYDETDLIKSFENLI